MTEHAIPTPAEITAALAQLGWRDSWRGGPVWFLFHQRAPSGVASDCIRLLPEGILHVTGDLSSIVRAAEALGLCSTARKAEQP